MRLGGQGHGGHLVAPELGGRAVSVPLDQPVFIVGLPEPDEGQAKLLDGAEGPDPQEVLLQRADEALGAAVAFRRTDEVRGRGGAEPGDLLLEVMRHGLAPVVVADREALGRARLDPAETLHDTLADRLECLKPGAAQGGMEAWRPTHSAEQ